MARPLPPGVYNFTFRSQGPQYQVCNFVPPFRRLHLRATVTAPEGTVWEAFFEPDTSGCDSEGVELAPNTFTVDGRTSTVTALKYENGKAVLETDPFNDLSGLHLHLIRQDGTIDMALAGDAATQDKANEKLTWDVPYAPWTDGDRLMLRLTSVALLNGPPEDSSSR